MVGCNSNAVASDGTNENVDTSRFKVLLKENIADGPLTEVTVTVLVDKVTRVMYVQTLDTKRIKPKEYATRAEAAMLIYQAIEKLNMIVA